MGILFKSAWPSILSCSGGFPDFPLHKMLPFYAILLKLSVTVCCFPLHQPKLDQLVVIFLGIWIFRRVRQVLKNSLELCHPADIIQKTLSYWFLGSGAGMLSSLALQLFLPYCKLLNSLPYSFIFITVVFAIVILEYVSHNWFQIYWNNPTWGYRGREKHLFPWKKFPLFNFWRKKKKKYFRSSKGLLTYQYQPLQIT